MKQKKKERMDIIRWPMGEEEAKETVGPAVMGVYLDLKYDIE
jgi:hypothetical protein